MNITKKFGIWLWVYTIVCVGLVGLGLIAIFRFLYACTSGPDFLTCLGSTYEMFLISGFVLGSISLILLSIGGIGLLSSRKWGLQFSTLGLYACYIFALNIGLICYRTSVCTGSFLTVFNLPPFLIFCFALLLQLQISRIKETA